MSNINPDYELLFQIIKHYEGFYPNAYQDSGGVWTIGIGSTYNFDKGRKVQKGDYMTEKEAVRYVEIEVKQKVKELNHYIKVPLTVYQSTAMVDYTYNRGIGNLLKTKLDELINANPNDPRIISEIKGTGLRDRAGNLLWGLGRRRRTEALLYEKGILQFKFPRWS
jgi:lysozyme